MRLQYRGTFAKRQNGYGLKLYYGMPLQPTGDWTTVCNLDYPGTIPILVSISNEPIVAKEWNTTFYPDIVTYPDSYDNIRVKQYCDGAA